MEQRRRSGKLAVILHADVAGSTALVQQDEDLAHERIQDSFRRFSDTITKYHGHVRELRGDALLAEFERASDAVTASLAFQAEQAELIAQFNDAILPMVRVGIAMGEVIVADNTVTGAGVVLAQRVEQLAEPGGVCITGAIHEALPHRMPFVQANLGEQQVKGFEESVRVYRVAIKPGEAIPPPEKAQQRKASNTLGISAAVAAIILIAAGGLAFWFQPWMPEEEPASVERMAFPLPDKPSIAVLPFDNLSGPDQEHLADGLTEEIITTLSKSPNLFVIARNSTFTYKGKAVDVRQVAEEQGVHYVLEGSVQHSGDRVRINAQLIDALEGHHIWAERYDREINDIFALQDDITQNIMIALEVELVQGAGIRLIHARAPRPEAFEQLQKSRLHYYRFNKEDNAISRDWAKKAAEISPDYPDAWEWMGWTHLNDYRFGWSTDREASFERSVELAEKAYELDPKSAGTNMLLGYLSVFRGQYDEAISYFRKAVELAPSNANAIAMLAWGLCYSGHPEEAIPLLKQAMRLSPVYPAWHTATLGLAYMMTRAYPKAIAANEQLVERKSLLLFGYSRLAAIHAVLGNDERARAYAADLLKIKPDFAISNWSKALIYKNKEDLDWELNALRKAGLPENPPLDLPDKPSIAVLPFDNLSGDKEQDPIADGLTEDIITSLSRVPDLFVIARNSTFTYKGKAVRVEQVARDLGVRYVLEGSVQRSGDHLRVTAQLIDAIDENHLWADRYDRPAENLFALQDEITRKVLVELQVKLIFGEHARVSSHGTKSLEAWLLRNQAFAEGSKYTKESTVKARELYQAAVDADPAYSRAWAGMSWTYWTEARWGGWKLSRDEALKKATEFAEHAIEMDPQGPVGYQMMANISLLKNEHDRAVALAEQAVELAPNDFQTNAALGWQLFWAGEARRSLEAFARAKRLSPRYPAWIPGVEGVAQHMIGLHEDAIVTLSEAIRRLPTNHMARARLIAVYAELDRLEEAKPVASELLELQPEFTIQSYLKTQPFKSPERKEWVRDLLLKAGLPESE